jgi:hypothetical protein
MSIMSTLKVVGRVPCYKSEDEAERWSDDTREIAVEISKPDGVLVVDLALTGEENAVWNEGAPRLWIHWGHNGWTIEIHKDEGSPFVEVNIVGASTATTIKRGFDNKIVDARKLDEP